MENKWPYMAGIIDGEGTIALCTYTRDKQIGTRTYVRAEIRVVNTRFDLIKWCMANFGGRFRTDLNNRRGYGQKSQVSPLYVWWPSGRANKEKLLLGILPHLILKREQAKLMLEFLRLGSSWDYEKKLNLAKKCSFYNNSVGESPETNTFENSSEFKIESELASDSKSEPVVT